MSYRAIDALRPRGAVSVRPSLLPASRAPVRGWRRRASQTGLLLAALLAAGSALALITGTWIPNGSTSATSNVSGVTVTFAGNASDTYANGAFNTTNGGWWTDPYGSTVNSGGSLVILHEGASRTYTVTFSKPVNNPVLHMDRLGGAFGNTDGQTSNSSRWTLTGSSTQTGGVTLTRLSGNSQFTVDTGANRIYREPDTFTGTADAECRTSQVARGTACGSVRFNGTGITSLTFTVDSIGPTGGDGLEMRWSFAGANVIVRKQSVGGTNTFGFTASNALSQTFNLATTAQNTPVSSATYPVTNHAAAITLAETVPSGYVLTGATCTDQDNASVAATVNTAGGQVTIATANYRANQTITCTFSNSATASLALAKTWVNAAVNDTAVLSATGGANNATLSSTANTASETDTGTAVQVAPGNVITLAETLGAGNARTYTASAWTCSGGSLSGNTLTLTSAHVGQAIVCTITNSARVTDVSVVKSTAAGPAVSGQVRNFTVVVSNAGPSAADGSIVSDTPGTGLTCPVSGNPISCTASGGAACPGAAALPTLVSGGVAVPTLPSGGSVTFTVPCQVTASGF